MSPEETHPSEETQEGDRWLEPALILRPAIDGDSTWASEPGMSDMKCELLPERATRQPRSGTRHDPQVEIAGLCGPHPIKEKKTLKIKKDRRKTIKILCEPKNRVVITHTSGGLLRRQRDFQPIEGIKK